MIFVMLPNYESIINESTVEVKVDINLGRIFFRSLRDTIRFEMVGAGNMPITCL